MPDAAAAAEPATHGVSELRLVLTVDDHARALAFYRDRLGLTELEAYEERGGHVTILAAGRATLELNDEPYAAFIDEVEVGRRVPGRVRVAVIEGTGGPVTVDTAGSDFDTIIGVYDTELAQVACVDDVDSLQARVTFDTEPDQNYLVQIGGYGGSTGRLEVQTASEDPPATEPAATRGRRWVWHSPTAGPASDVECPALGSMSAQLVVRQARSRSVDRR